MTFLQLLPTIVSLLAFCAHLFRNGLVFFVPLVLLTLPLLFVRHGLVARFFQAFLAFDCVIWVLSGVSLAMKRHEAGEHWLRPLLILCGVALFTLFAAALFESERLRQRYPRRLVF